MTPVTVSECLGALERVLGSTQFRRAPKLCELLTYICREATSGHPERLTEREIGRAVFGRAEFYDSNNDNIVRVQARNLRKRLDQYYQTEGAADPLAIVIPKGAYIPEFRRRSQDSAAGVAAWSLAGPLTRTLARLSIAAALIAFGAWIGTRGQSTLNARSDSAPELFYPWSKVISPDRPTMLVVSDSTFSMAQRLLGRTVSLDEYLSAGVESAGRGRSAIPRELCSDNACLQHVTWREHTVFSNVPFVARILALAGPQAHNVDLRFPRSLDARSFGGKNLIVLGSVRSVPWIELFEPKFNFVFRYDDEAGTPYFVNRNPLPGEQAVYVKKGPFGAVEETYSHIALAPNLDEQGYALIVSSAEAQDSAANFLFSPARLEALSEQLKLGEAGCCFEALIKTSGGHGTSAAELVASRSYPVPNMRAASAPAGAR
jgi:hypothetical protein